MSDPAVVALAEALADRYRLERELGRGGMATVWLARDLPHERLGALKLLRPELLGRGLGAGLGLVAVILLYLMVFKPAM